MDIWATIERIFNILWNRLYYLLADIFGEEVNPDWLLPEE